MNVLESPLDALALGHLSYGILNIVNNLWTWLAVVTTAVGFWRIRAAGPTTSSSFRCESPGLRSSAPPPIREVTQPDDDQTSASPRAQPSAPSPAPGGEVQVDGLTKGKFTVRYEDDGERDGGATAVKEWRCKESERVAGEWWEDWERVLRMRRGEMGWYSHQNLTAINGNVVRLWEERYSSNGVGGFGGKWNF